MAASVHLRGIVIAGVLAAVALALGFVTLAMNQTASQAAPHTILPLKARHHLATTVRTTAAARKPAHAKAAKPKAKPKPLDPNLVAALQAGLPRSVAQALAARPVAVVQLTSKSDPVAALAAGEAKAGAAAANASYVAVNVDQNGGDVEVLTRLLGQLPVAPASLIYTRPAKLATTLPNFNDRTVVEQAAVSATPETTLAGNNTWATQANAICTAGNAEQTALSKQGSKTNYAADSAVSHKVIAQLTALKPPAGEQASLKTANALLTQAMALMDQAVAKGPTSKAAGPLFLNALTQIGKAFVTYNRLGATVCTTAT